MSGRVSTLVHKYLRIPYVLHAHEFQSPKKPKATFVFIHGIGGTHESWQPVVSRLPDDVQLIGIDLLGFGQSPKPAWAEYNAKTQARSVVATLLKLRLRRKVILVGHSLGALVSVEVVKRYGFAAKRLVLCSPPFYQPEALARKLPSNDDMLRRIYRVATKHPERLAKFSAMAVRLGLANKTISVTESTVGSYIAALESSIINQTALEDAAKLSQPMTIFYGALDPVVISKHITALAKLKDTVVAKRLLAGHEVTGAYAVAVAKHLSSVLEA